MWKNATLKAGLRFGVTTHLSRSYSWLNTANQSDTKGRKKGVPYDGAQGKGKDYIRQMKGKALIQELL